ncbi:MAG TPA: DUF885 domain-containing protein [Casimicrobiaceae bacterium]
MRLAAALLTVLTALPGGALASDEDARFAAFVDRTLDAYWKLNPEDAFGVGYYKYADRASIPDAAARAARVEFDTEALGALAGFDPKRLSPSNRVDLVLLRNQLESDRWYATVLRDWEWQPSQYNVADSFQRQLTTEYAPYDTRLRHVLARLDSVPAYYAAAKASIDRPTLEHTVLALEQNRAALETFDEKLMRDVDASQLTASEKALFKARAAGARAAIGDYVAFLTDLRARLEKGGARTFRIGKALYAQKFAYDIQSGYTLDRLYEMAKAEKASLLERMELMARILWPKYMGGAPMPGDRLELIGAVIDELSKRHGAPDAIVDAVRKQIPELEKFVSEHDLVDQDPTRPLVVRVMPAYLRGNTGAFIQAAGPYDPTANTYYDVEPLEGYAPEKAESYMREYNDWTLQLLSIHEAVPGHYVQLLHANKTRSVVKTIFGSGSMIEGWAVYGERMMMEAGYGNNTPEMWLMWMKWNLRAVCNTIIDVEVQTGDMDRERLVSFLTREAFQSRSEAELKWRRVTLNQVQLVSYYDGYAEILALREEEKARLGRDFKLKDFNNRFLSYGSAPVRYIRELMREDH